MDLMSGGMRSQGETDRETLCEVAREFHQLEVEDATPTERAVCGLLEDAGYIRRHEVKEILNFGEPGAQETVAWVEYRAIFSGKSD